MGVVYSVTSLREKSDVALLALPVKIENNL
jgi:hypothetical protein